MNPEQLQARLQPRSAWQAMDLGARLYRAWWLPLTGTWLLFTLVPFCLLFGLAGGEHFFLASIIFWFLKPLWEKPLLEYCARALFGEKTAPLRLLREFPGYGFRGLASLLTLRRLSPFRSFNLPVFQLERSHGETLRRRLRILHLPPANRSGTLTLLMLHIEQGLVLAFLLLLYMLAPWQFNLELADWLMMRERTHQLLTAFSWYLALCITEPLYIACGFALYINKRTRLEAWDLEQGLRRIGRRRRSLAGGAMALLLTLPVMWPGPAEAGQAPDPAREQAQELVAGPDFMPMETERQWRQREWLRDQQWLERLLEWWWEDDDEARTGSRPDIGWLANALRFVLVVVTISLVLWLIWRYRDLLGAIRRGGRRDEPPVSVAGLDIRAESLPDDIGAAVLAALDRDNPREALALLYRASLSRLVRMQPLPLHPGTTESECLEMLRQQLGGDPRRALMERLTPLWIAAAWAHRRPDRQEILACLEQWQSLFADNREVGHASA